MKRRNTENGMTAKELDDSYEKEQRDYKSNQGLFWQLFEFLKVRKKYWLLPLIVLLLTVGILIIIGSSTSLSSFIYALF